ncbi:MAG TPA: hypothetical protein VGF45_19160 [Polyangia bacterium]
MSPSRPPIAKAALFLSLLLACQTGSLNGPATGTGGRQGTVATGGAGGGGGRTGGQEGGAAGGGSGTGGMVVDAGLGDITRTDAAVDPGIDARATDTRLMEVGPSDGVADVTPGPAAGIDTPPPRPLNVTAPRMRYTHRFRTKDADPQVSFNDNTQIAVVDTRSAKMVGKLVLPFDGAGTTAGGLGAAGTFCVSRGFHVLGIAAFQMYDILKNDPAFYGAARRQVFEGVEHTRKYDFANIRMVPSDGVAKRTEMALKYLHRLYPAEDWGYFLNADGTVRWSDVIFTGFSHGASNSARFAMLVRAWRAVSFAGPRENTCNNFPACLTANGLISAHWLDEVPATPRDRFFALTGTRDDQNQQHLFSMEKIGYSGKPTSMSVGPPYGGSHRIVEEGGGHTSPCNETTYKALCNYLFGVAPENLNGIP